ncbi:cysteine--1-D-myo-inosityl 2-amino-2-deoxy-alpha-D-glucopyranoside ligase [Haloechinothrix sp. LS1_15]|uniref:cysteine--1-D-myo-inosityl 2-amino-2-deoxy-alpha-D-glucopyranoside ligase n=1 Tax=Haloechinothrix sp. LS1_15 TaxID=2652248 RepID=UPI002946B0FA|nr:cysteine--1-D-myo-inosityl 2-amino-2-deoxy-alpha-D-glucopyranoside ligase [Haloechinothrix sp. LS1_15]MDV6013972.1 cysteine--1-D-myo-inosityl 2-amino-2-deoxy-alpha-D-glucopyranoside ligase [Haloechinothrix sp. LS1_15]
MESWSPIAVPRLPGTPRQLRLYDTATQSLQPVAPGRAARMYVCGITPYDATHLGHAATYLAFDLVYRFWLDAGHEVHYVQNVTDIDDPLLERAERDQDDWVVLAMRETALFREDMEFLRVLPPTEFVGAVETIPEIVEFVRKLLASGAAYRADDPEYPDVYFAHDATGRFGYESNYDTETMNALFAERGGDPERPGKRHPLDALLWRMARPGEPSWESELGEGRPGWHVECSAIALNRLGIGFDIQGGGSDLAFPHHEFSAAHAEALSGDEPFARLYVHAGMIGLNGQKMSKSKGNLEFVSRLRADGVDPAALRLALLAGHYRSDRQWTADLLGEAEQRLASWREAAALPSGPPARELVDQVRDHLADDLDTPGALAAVDAWMDQARTTGGTDADAPGLLADTVDALLGIPLHRVG